MQSTVTFLSTRQVPPAADKSGIAVWEIHTPRQINGGPTSPPRAHEAKLAWKEIADILNSPPGVTRQNDSHQNQPWRRAVMAVLNAVLQCSACLL